VTIVGLGSGGAAVSRLLGMCGIGSWHLFDPDVLEPPNLVKHLARRGDLGRPKTTIMADWLLDRMPGAVVHDHPVDVFESGAFETAVGQSDLVICAVDNAEARAFVNEKCVRLATPCSTGSVTRTGLGGEVYLYRPGETGCHSCMERVCVDRGWVLDDRIPLTDQEQNHRYGLGESAFVTSGLSTDIAVIAALQAHMSLGLLLGTEDGVLRRPEFNWLQIVLRREAGVDAAPYSATRMRLKPQQECHLACGSPR
jgi:molybdopterin/thiamine biosynthesis adenylyltransferase